MTLTEIITELKYGAVILRVRKDYRGLCPKSMLMCLQGQYQRKKKHVKVRYC